MKYINILLIILLIIIISYIIIYKIKNKETFFTQILDNNFKILEINNKLNNEYCDENSCDIVSIDNFKKLNDKDNKGLFYLTSKNDIYVIKNIGGPNKLNTIIKNQYDITSIKFSDDSQYIL